MGETPYPDNPFRFKKLNRLLSRFVAQSKDLFPVGSFQLVGGYILSALIEERKGAIVHNEKIPEKLFRGSETVPGPSPESRTTHFAPCAGKAVDGPLGMNLLRLIYLSHDPHPVSHHTHLPEGDTCLQHTPGTRVHADQDNPFRHLSIFLEIMRQRLAGVIGGIVGDRNGMTPTQLPKRSTKSISYLEERWLQDR